MPILNVEPSKLDERASEFHEAGGRMCAQRAFAHLELKTSLAAYRVAVEAYFYLNAAYKAERIPTNSKTRFAKVAAIIALALGYVKPIRPNADGRINDEEYEYVNGALAMRLASGLVKHRFDKRPFDDQRRWYRMVQNIDFPSLEPLIREANANGGVIQTTFTPQLTQDEISKIDAFVEAFEIISLLGEHDAAFR